MVLATEKSRFELTQIRRTNENLCVYVCFPLVTQNGLVNKDVSLLSIDVDGYRLRLSMLLS